jgi:hypothetical protein
MRRNVGLVITVCSLCLIPAIFGSAVEHKLIDHLFSHYDKRVRPTVEADEAVQLHIENIHLKRLTHINEADGTVDIGLWTGFSWNDSVLSWEPSMYGGVKHIAVRANQIWTPDTILFSGWGVAEDSLRDREETDVIILSTGVVYYYPSVKLILPCLKFNASGTTGELECNFGLGSWVLSSDVLKVHLKKKEFDVEKYIIDPKYDLLKTSLEVMTIKVPAFCDGLHTWELVVGRITMKKK